MTLRGLPAQDSVSHALPPDRGMFPDAQHLSPGPAGGLVAAHADEMAALICDDEVAADVDDGSHEVGEVGERGWCVGRQGEIEGGVRFAVEPMLGNVIPRHSPTWSNRDSNPRPFESWRHTNYDLGCHGRMPEHGGPDLDGTPAARRSDAAPCRRS
jgi:hypothetical protein